MDSLLFKEKMNLIGQNIVVFDCEIKNIIDGKSVRWSDHEKMGISVACLFDFKTMDYMVYLDDNINALVDRLNYSDLVVGFNINGFDIPLVKACIGKTLNFKVYDILDESRHAVGYRPGKQFPRGLKLDDHLLGTFGPEHVKTAHGSEAPIMYQNGKMGDLISYCLADVKREAKLFKHIWDRFPVKTITHGERILSDPRKFINGDNLNNEVHEDDA